MTKTTRISYLVVLFFVQRKPPKTREPSPCPSLKKVLTITVLVAIMNIQAKIAVIL